MWSQRLSRRLVRGTGFLVPVLGAAVLLLVVPAGDEPPRAPLRASQESAPSASTTTPDVLVMTDGARLSGEILREGPEHVVFRTSTGEVRLLRPDQVASRLVGTRRTGPSVRVRLVGGRVVTGTLLADEPSHVEVRLEGGAVITLRRADVATVER